MTMRRHDPDSALPGESAREWMQRLDRRQNLPGGRRAYLTPAQRVVVLGGSQFSPDDIAGLQLWLDADSSTLWQDSARTTLAAAADDPVGAWDDLSGNGKHVTQATAGRRPLLKLAVKNGRRAILFDSTDDGLSVVLAISQPCTLIFAGTARTDDFGELVSSNDGLSNLISNGGGAAFRMYAGSIFDAAGVTWSNWHSVIGAFNGAASVSSVDGSETTGDPGAGNGDGTVWVGNYSGLNAPLGGYAGTVLAYNRQLSASERTNVIKYLRARWGTP